MANKIHDAFDGIKADPRLIESTKQYLSEKYQKKPRLIHRLAFQRVLATACMVLILAVGIGGYSWIQTPVSYVSIDVNPSIELALNRIDRVVSVTAYNTEGDEILKNLPLIGKNYTDAIDMIVESKDMSIYLTDESELVFTVATASNRESELKSGVEKCSSHIDHKSQSVSADIEVVPKAHDHGLSVGKYYAYLQLSKYDDTVTVDECKDMSMREIHGLINEHEQDGTHEQNENHGTSEIHEQSEIHRQNENHKQDDTQKQDEESGDLEESGTEEVSTTSYQQGEHHGEGHHE